MTLSEAYLYMALPKAHYYMIPSKANYYMTPSIIAQRNTQQYLSKPRPTLDNIYKNPNTILDNILLKTQILFLTNHYFKKPKYYTWQDLIKSPKLLIFGKQLFHKNQNIIWKNIILCSKTKINKVWQKYFPTKKKKSYFKAQS